jgi:hypothetical protein
MIRSQYHFRDSQDGLLAWNVSRLIELSKGLEVRLVAVSSIREVDQNHWYAFERQSPTCRSILDHIALIEAADLACPIILDAEGGLMDGMHRVCKAILRGDTHIQVVQFPETPRPDYIGLRPQDLPY